MLRTHKLGETVWVLCLLLAGGCQTAQHRHTSEQKKRSPTDNQQWTGGDAALEKRAQAHAHYAAGIIQEMDEKPEAALKEYSQAALKDPDNEALVLEVSRRFLQNKQTESALELLSRAAARPSVSGVLLARLGFVYAQLGKSEQAMVASRAAIKKAPGSLMGYQTLCHIYLQNKQPVEAMKILDEAARQPKETAEFLIGLAELYSHLGVQTPTQRKEANTKAISVLNRAEGMSRLNPAMRMKVADDYNVAGDSARAAQIYLDLLKKLPDVPGVRERVRARLADIYLRGSDRKHAAEQLEGIIADDPTNAQAYYSLAAIASEEGQLDKAEEYLRKAMVINPEAAPPYAELARVQIGQKKISDALGTLEKARAKFPRTFALEYLSGIAYSQQKAYAEAIQHYTAAEVIAQATEPKWLDQHFYFDLGAAYERKADYAEAEKNFEKCLKLAPDFPEALNYLGYMWAEHGLHLERARELIEKAVKIEPANPAYLDSLGWVLFKSDQPKEAVDYVLKAVELSEEPDATLYDHLGDIYAALKQTDKAREAWQKSLTVEANDQVRKKVEELK